MRTLAGILLAVVTTGFCCPPTTFAANIEAVKGKEYTLTKKHGPWMVMVAVFSEPHEAMKTQEGLTPEQAAEELIFELRQKGIPAYSFRREKSTETVQALNRLQEMEDKHYKLDTEICVLAGNYQSPESDKELAKRTLKWIKNYHPKALEQGGIYKRTPGQPGMLSGAFLTINPMLNVEEVKKKQRDPEIIRFNSHYEHSLLNNAGKYTVVVASFYPNSITQISGNSQFSKSDFKDVGGFEQATHQAWQVTRELRRRDMDAYVFHDHRRSIVTIGAFNSPNDPGVQSILKTFTAQWKPNPQTGVPQLIGEVLIMPSQEGQWMCTFDPKPQIMEVPYK